MRDIRELFPTDDPVKPDLLIGRAGDVRDLASRLGEGTHMVMAGPRRTGKSTVGLAALQRVRSSKVYTAQVDLWDHEDLASLTRALAQSIIANRGPVAKTLGLGGAIGLAQRIAERDKKRIVLFLDEFQDIAVSSNRFGDPDVLTKQFAGLQRAVFVGTFTSSHRSPHVSGRPGSPGAIASSTFKRPKARSMRSSLSGRGIPAPRC